MTMDTAEALAELRKVMESLSTPWRTRREAAQHCRTSPATIDYLADKGILERVYFCGQPRFHVDKLNAMMTKVKLPLGKKFDFHKEEAA